VDLDQPRVLLTDSEIGHGSLPSGAHLVGGRKASRWAALDATS
jgi:hypothetical protein